MLVGGLQADSQRAERGDSEKVGLMRARNG